MTSIPQTLKAPTPLFAPALRAELQEGRAPTHAAPKRASDDIQAARMRDPYFCFELI